MNCWYFFIIDIFFVSVIVNIGHVLKLDAQQDERIRLECTLTSKADAEEVNLMKNIFNSIYFF